MPDLIEYYQINPHIYVYLSNQNVLILPFEKILNRWGKKN